MLRPAISNSLRRTIPLSSVSSASPSVSTAAWYQSAAKSAVPATTSIPSSYPLATRSIHSSPALSSAWPVTFDPEQAEAAAEGSSSPHNNIGGAQERRSARLQQSAPIDRTDAGSTRGTRQKLEMPKSKAAKSLLDLKEMKRKGIPIACLTAYDYPTALSLRRSDLDICLVGDSMANVALGHSSTQSLSLDATVHHCQAVYRGLFSPVLSLSPDTPGAPLLIADVPFGTFHTSEEDGVRSAVRLLKEGGADGVKIEGGKEILPLVRRLTQFGIPVMGHLGLQPQRVASTAGYRLQGRTADEAMQILEEALALQEAGAFSIVLECIPNRVGQIISQQLDIPTIGIGAGPLCDGQILVTNDLLGELTSPWHVVVGLEDEPEASSSSSNVLPRLHPDAPKGPKFVRNFVETAISPRLIPTSSSHTSTISDSTSTSSSSSSSSSTVPTSPSMQGAFGLGAMRMAAVESYVQAVRDRSFPDPEREGYKMRGEELREFTRRVEATTTS